jgi:preprotein translocase subunit YajC
MLSASSSGGNPFALLLPFLLLGGIFYFMILRPQQRRTREQQALVNSVEEGDEILIAGAGIYGTITEIDDEDGTVTVEIAPGTEIRMLRGGIARRVTESDYDDEEEASYDEEEADGDAAADMDVDADAHTEDGAEHQDHPDQPGQIKEL